MYFITELANCLPNCFYIWDVTSQCVTLCGSPCPYWSMTLLMHDSYCFDFIFFVMLILHYVFHWKGFILERLFDGNFLYFMFWSFSWIIFITNFLKHLYINQWFFFLLIDLSQNCFFFQIDYYLEEDSNWSVSLNELDTALMKSSHYCEPRAILIINPGNPTGNRIINFIYTLCMQTTLVLAFWYRSVTRWRPEGLSPP